MDVNIYVDSTIKNPNRGEGTAMYLLECIVNGEPKTIEDHIYLPDTTEDAAIVTALIEALGRVKDPAKTKVRLFVRAKGVFNAISSGRIQASKIDKFKTAKGKPVKNAELWSIFLTTVPRYHWTITDEDHSYEQYMRGQLKKWQDR